MEEEGGVASIGEKQRLLPLTPNHDIDHDGGKPTTTSPPPTVHDSSSPSSSSSTPSWSHSEFSSGTHSPPSSPKSPSCSSSASSSSEDDARSTIASLDFETVINDHSIEAARERFLLPVEYDDVRRRRADSNVSAYDNFVSLRNRDLSPSLGEEEEGGTAERGRRRPPKRRHRPKLSWRGYTGRTFFRWAFMVLTGALTGAVTIVILAATEYLVGIRLASLNSLEADDRRDALSDVVSIGDVDGGGRLSSPVGKFHLIYNLFLDSKYTRNFLEYAAFNLTLALLSSAMCLFLAPEAVGSGIPETMAYLNGVRVRKFTDVMLFVVKIVGTVLSVSSSLVVGPEGPLVHLGAVIGAGLTKSAGLERCVWRLREGWEDACRRLRCRGERRAASEPDGFGSDYDSDDDSHPDCFCSGLTNLTSDLSHFRNDAERRDLITIGAASGFAAAFGAPVGSLLFSMEEASTFFSRNLLFKTLCATATATFCVAVYRGDLSEYGVVSLGSYEGVEEAGFLGNRVKEVPLYAAVGAAGGLLGAAFNNTWRWMHGRRTEFFRGAHLTEGGGWRRSWGRWRRCRCSRRRCCSCCW